MTPRFLQLHLLTSYPAALLNRDDAGYAKRLPFGSATRTRISSQCMKRHWRTFDGEGSLGDLGLDLAVRSRLTFQKFVYEPLLQDGTAPALAEGVTRALMEALLGQSAKAKKADPQDESGASKALQTSQITVLGRRELAWILDEARAICAESPDPKKLGDTIKARITKEKRKNLEALRKAASGLDGAMFGRMVTSDILARGDAALHVAHAFTVHAEQSESDYFSAVDELLGGDEGGMGSGHINASELTSGLYYVYIAVDLPLLVSNLEGCDAKNWESADRDTAARVLESLIQIVATVSPGAKLGSTAPHAYANMVLAELGNAQPRTLANAFLNPVRTSANAPDLAHNAFRALQAHVTDLDQMYGRVPQRRVAALGARDELAKALQLDGPVTLADLATWVGQEVKGGQRALTPA